MSHFRRLWRALFTAALVLPLLTLAAPPASALSANVAVLTASRTVAVVGTTVLHAQTPVDIATTGDTLTIWRVTGPDRSTWQWLHAWTVGTSFWTQDTATTPTTREYIATLSDGTTERNSNPVAVKWVSASLPSSTCATPVLDPTIEGQEASISVTAMTTALDVCARLNTDIGGVGGKLSITATGPSVGLGSLPVPTTDLNAAACSTTAGNLIPGSHPIISGGSPTPYSVDAYSDGTQVWVCLSIGGGNLRVAQPLGVPGTVVDPGVSFSFMPDGA